MSDQLETKSISSQSTSSLNRARIIDFSEIENTPPANKKTQDVKTKTMKKINFEDDDLEKEWRDLLTKSLQEEGEEEEKSKTPVKKISGAKEDRTADVRAKLSGKFQRCCPICLSEFDKIRGSLECLHQFCFSCISQWTQSSTICPCCRKPFTSILKMIREQPIGPIKETLRISVQKKELVYETQYDHYLCYQCGSGQDQNVLLICDDCDFYCCHVYCDPELNGAIPDDDWYCLYCRERHRRRRKPGFITLHESQQSRFSDFTSPSQDSEKGVSSRTRSRQLIIPVQRRTERNGRRVR